MYYSFKGAYPTPVPNRIVLSDGRTKTDPATFTDKDLEDAGWKKVSAPPQATYPNKVDWDGNNWIVREPNNSERSFKIQHVKDWCQERLKATDYKVIKSIESGVPLEEDFKLYRQQVRDLYNNIPHLEDVWNVVYPKPPVVEEE